MAIKMYDLAGADRDRRFSPYCWRVRMALAHKELEVETIPWRFIEKGEIAFSGQGTVPVMVDGETTVCDSWAIALYLEETYPDRPALFGSPQARAHALFVKFWDEKVLSPALGPIAILDVYNCLDEKDKPYFRETREARFGKSLEAVANNSPESLERLRTALAPLRETLRSQSFLAGDAPNFADYIVFARLQFARCTSPAQLLEPDDPVCAWRGQMLSLFSGLARQAPGYPVPS